MRANKNYKSAKKKIKDFRNRDAGVNPKVAEKKRLEGEDAASAVEAGYSTSPMRVKNSQGQTVLEVSQGDTKEYRRQMGGSPAEKKASENKEYVKTTKKYSKGGKTIKMSKYAAGGEVDPPKGKITPKEELDRLTMNELRKALDGAGVAGIPIGAGAAKYSSEENKGMSSFAYDLNAMTSAAKKKGVYQDARMKAVAEWRKKYGTGLQE